MHTRIHHHAPLRQVALLGGFAVLLSLIIAASPAPIARNPAPQQPYSVRVEFDVRDRSVIKEVIGIESEIEVIEYQDGDDPVVHKRPGRVKYGDITLKREFVKDDALREWYKKVLAGTTDRKSGSVIYLDRAGNEVMRYNLFEAWPCRWKAPELNSKGATESIDFCVEKIERK